MAAGGYPEKYRKGDPITGLSKELPEHLKVFHAGTRLDDGNVVTNGGRVLCAVALGDTVTEAQRDAYELVSQISWQDAYYRTDIGYRAYRPRKEELIPGADRPAGVVSFCGQSDRLITR